jgi:hypothetical protein
MAKHPPRKTDKQTIAWWRNPTHLIPIIGILLTTLISLLALFYKQSPITPNHIVNTSGKAQPIIPINSGSGTQNNDLNDDHSNNTTTVNQTNKYFPIKKDAREPNIIILNVEESPCVRDVRPYGDGKSPLGFFFAYKNIGNDVATNIKITIALIIKIQGQYIYSNTSFNKLPPQNTLQPSDHYSDIQPLNVADIKTDTAFFYVKIEYEDLKQKKQKELQTIVTYSSKLFGKSLPISGEYDSNNVKAILVRKKIW